MPGICSVRKLDRNLFRVDAKELQSGTKKDLIYTFYFTVTDEQ